MAKKSKNTGGPQTTKGGSKQQEEGGGSKALDTSSSKAPSGDEKEAAAAAAAAASTVEKAVLSEVINKRLRNLRKKLQRAESYEAKRAGGGELNPDQLLAIAKTDGYVAVIKELEELAQLSADIEANEQKKALALEADSQQAIADAEKLGREGALADESHVHQQTLRLVYAVKDKLAKVDRVSEDEKSTLARFYNLVFAGVADALDEKLSVDSSSSAELSAKHLRLLFSKDDALVPGLEASIGARYSDIASIVDNVIAAPIAKDYTISDESKAKDDAAVSDGKKPLAVDSSIGGSANDGTEAAKGEDAGEAVARDANNAPVDNADVAAEKPQTTEKQEAKESTGGVRMPKLPSMFAKIDESEPVDSDFNAQVIVPPGGLKFMASDDISSSSDDDSEGEEHVVEMVQVSKLNDGPADVAMPVPNEPDDVNDLNATNSGNDGVGGFTHPLHANTQTSGDSSSSNNAPSGETLGDSTAAQSMPVPDADASNSTDASAAAQVPGNIHPGAAAGFNAFGAPPGVDMHQWTPAGATSNMPAIPGMYGVLPLPYPPHLAMQYGYIPPHMYNMAAINAAGGILPNAAGANTGSIHQSGAASTTSHTGTPSARASPAVPDAARIQQQNTAASALIGSGASGQSEFWSTGSSNNDGSNVKSVAHSTGLDSSSISAIQQQQQQQQLQTLQAAPQPMIPMPSGDPYQHAMAVAAAAAAGYPINAPFGYPNIDTSNLSTAATGGSDNNDSIKSYDSTSNKGGSSRPSSVHYYQQQHQQAATGSTQDAAARGLPQQPGINEYLAMVQYGWPAQPDYIKHHQQGMYNYSYPQYQQQQQQQQQQQPGGNNSGFGGGQGQSYRRRGSGSNSSGSGSSHHHSHHYQQRDRRGNSNYNNKQRWNSGNGQNNNNNNNNGHHYRQAQQHHHAQTQTQDVASGYSITASSDVPTGSSSNTYYGTNYQRQK